MALLIVVKGGLPGRSRSATVGHALLTRSVGERRKAFRDRVMAEAEASGEPLAVIGGLPECRPVTIQPRMRMSDEPPSPGDRCDCCQGNRWWTARSASRGGWRCSECIPAPAGLAIEETET